MFTVKAAAIDLPTGGHFMTLSETQQFIGDQIPVRYFNGSDYVDAVATYAGQKQNPSGFTEYSDSPVGFVSSAPIWLMYTCSLPGANSNNDYIEFHLEPSYSIFDTEYIYTCYAFSSASQISTVFTSPNSDWYIGGVITHFANSSASTNSSSKAWLRGSSNSSGSDQYCSYIPIVHSSATKFSAYSIDCEFQGNSSYRGNGYYTLYVMAPYVSGDATGASGTFAPDQSGSGNINVNVDVDMDETNGLLDDIKQGIAGIGNTILGLFVPDDEFMEAWVDDMQDLLSDHLGGLYEAVASLEDFWQQFENVQAKSAIHIGECRLPLAGSELVLGNWDVPLKPSGIPQVLYTSLALIIDFLAVMAFLRMCRNKLEIFLNPNSEVIKE